MQNVERYEDFLNLTGVSIKLHSIKKVSNYLNYINKLSTEILFYRYRNVISVLVVKKQSIFDIDKRYTLIS